MTTYSPQETAWQLIVSAVLDDDPRDDTRSSGPDELDELLAGMDDEAIGTLCAAAGMAASLVVALAESRGTTAEEPACPRSSSLPAPTAPPPGGQRRRPPACCPSAGPE